VAGESNLNMNGTHTDSPNPIFETLHQTNSASPNSNLIYVQLIKEKTPRNKSAAVPIKPPTYTKR
jgi:hypothetical protein